MMTYLVGDAKYSLSYQQLKDLHYKFVSMKDKEFLNNIPDALHLACIISYLKELGNECTIGDQGIIHELIHLIAIPDYPLLNLKQTRKQFKLILKLD